MNFVGTMAAERKTREELEKKKQLAFTLYVDNRFDQKVIASITGISEKTISLWKKKDHSSGLDWDEQRRFAMMGPDKQMRRIMLIYDNMLTQIEQRDAPDNVPNSKEADIMNKLADSVKKLTADITPFVKSEVGKQFVSYMQQTYGQAKAVEAVEMYHEFLMATSN